MPRHGCLPYGLYLVTPESDDEDALAALVEAALAGKPAVLQYRNKHASPKHGWRRRCAWLRCAARRVCRSLLMTMSRWRARLMLTVCM